jgi:hypothetical protein
MNNEATTADELGVLEEVGRLALALRPECCNIHEVYRLRDLLSQIEKKLFDYSTPETRIEAAGLLALLAAHAVLVARVIRKEEAKALDGVDLVDENPEGA